MGVKRGEEHEFSREKEGKGEIGEEGSSYTWGGGWRIGVTGSGFGVFGVLERNRG